MIKCPKCNGRMFIDRAFSEYSHMETFCIRCGNRKFYHDFSKTDGESAWLWKMEMLRMKASISR